MATKIEKAVKATVAPNKTVKFEGANVGPGGEVSLPADEVAYLRKMGYLVDPAVAAATIAPGPAFDKEDAQETGGDPE